MSQMFTQEDIDAVRKRAAEEKWSYPYLFNSLKAMGVERYEVNVLTHATKYVGMGAAVEEAPPADFTPLAAGEWNLEAVKEALRRTQSGETNYRQFLGEIAAAGVAFYRVDMRPRTVTYHGPKPYKYAETVPDTK